SEGVAMALLASIDPGVRHCGVALWSDGVLVHAYLASQSKDEPWLSFLRHLPTHLDQSVIEIPQVYPSSPVKHEDLIQLAASAGAIAGRLNCRVTQARPAIWTKQTTTNKEIRLERAWSKLTAGEIKKVDLPSAKA